MLKNALEVFASRFTPPGGFPEGGLCVPSLTGAADAFLALTLTDGPRAVLAITPGIPDAERLVDDLNSLSAKSPTRILSFPPTLDGEKSALGERLRTLAALRAYELSPYPAVIVVPFPALATAVSAKPPQILQLDLDTNSPAPWHFAEICKRLATFGYNRVPAVEREGDWSVRGGIVDCWPPGDEFPLRAEFFGDDLESLRTFDAATQISIGRVKRVEILPVTEEQSDPADKSASLLDFLPRDSIILALEHNEYSLSDEASGFKIVYSGEPAPRGTVSYAFQTTPLPGFSELSAQEAHHPELFEAARNRLEHHLASAKERGSVILRNEELSGGFEIPGLIVVTKADRVFTKPKTRRHTAASSSGVRINDFEDLEPGEYVVHVDYGVGRFIGSSEIISDGRRSEVFTIEYADGGKLHVPASHAHLLSRYVGVKGEAVRLHRLDGKRWSKDKAAAQKAVTDLAAALLETQARREITPGFTYDVHCDGLDAFEAAFPFEETDDQLAAIDAVKRDLAATKPMDRLICGDAGYGKTEVAMRAAYVAAMNGRQVAVLAPTTILAEQHFESFTSRFDGTPIRIESVSRFQSSATHEGTFKRLASGACDIVIGTHALLTSKIAFHDLGLIIIDEEQRFGVRHKEFLKRLRETADILTLSATPIPRTLYLSMTGARDLSLLRTPPRERVAVETEIVTDSDEIVRHAIESELERGGQAFFLHNRVSSISRAAKRIAALVPQARITVAHGQMDSCTLARKMRDFEHGEYNVLVSTTIVESGIDIPRANTIIVDHAEGFGLADLYQLRGRVGRSSRKGHAIFLLPSAGLVDSDARERLKALKRHGGLGAGFNLAVRDLELRGAGNLLGSQQSGHIAAVGFGLYCKLLKRTVAMLKGESVKDIVDVKLNVDFIDFSPASEDNACAASLPYDYVEEDSQRMSFMKRLAEADDIKEVRKIADELRDRYGPLPAPAKRLLDLTSIRVTCAALRIDRMDAREKRVVCYRTGSDRIFKVFDLKGDTADAKLKTILKSLQAC